MAISANGLISNRRNVPDWISQEYGKGFMEICQKTKAVIMGRKTYEILAPDNLPLKDERITIVLTSITSIEPANPTVIFTNKSPEDIVALLEEKNQPEAVIVGGMATVTEFINIGLVDEIHLVYEPVLFGDGLPLFKNSEVELKLSLISVEKLNNSIRTHCKILEQSGQTE
jgi:dihydrofolate reductase